MAGSNELDRKVEDVVNQIGKMYELNRKAVHSLREAADYLDGMSKTCRIVRIAGGLLLIGGGIVTVLSGGTAAPLVCAGLEVAGAGTTFGAAVVESIINSKQIISAQIAVKEAETVTNQVKKTFEIMGLDYLNVLFRTYELKLQLRNFLSLEGQRLKTKPQCTTKDGTAVSKSGEEGKGADTAVSQSGEEGKAADTAVSKSGEEADKTSKAGKKTGMTGEERTLKAFSVALNVISVGWDIKDLIEKKGSKAAPFLREKANEMEACIVDVKNKKIT